MKRTFLLVVVAAACVSPAAAALESWGGKTIDVEYWAGSGPNEALTVIDFGGGASYAFGYRWADGETFARPGESGYAQANPTGSAALSEAMLLGLADAGGLDLTYTYYNGLGMSIGSLSYGGQTIVSDWYTTFAGYWWDGHDAYEDFSGNPVAAETPDGTFATTDLGVSVRGLQDGYVDGWSLEYVSSGYSPLNAPVVPTPEPASLALLGLGGVALLRRRK